MTEPEQMRLKFDDKEPTSSVWKQYRKKSIAEMRPYVVGEDTTFISVGPEDYPPTEGDMVARNPDNPKDVWLVSKEFFEANYVPHND